jgi:hypothetical protein
LVLLTTVAAVVSAATGGTLHGQSGQVENLSTAEAVAAVGTKVRLGVTERAEAFNELRQSVAVLPGGGFAAVWTEGDGSFSGAIRLQYVLPSGEVGFPGGGLTLATSDDYNSEPVLVPHPTSGVFVAFRRVDRQGAGAVVVQWIDGEGRPQWPGAGVSAFGTPGEDFFWEQHLLADPSGDTFVCASGSRRGVVCQRLSSAGTPLWGPQGIAAGGQPGFRVVPKAASDGAGGVLVVWKNIRNPFDGHVDPELFEGQRFSGDGRLLWGETGKTIHVGNLSEPGFYSYRDLYVVGDGVGGAVIAFWEWNGRGRPNLDVLAQRVTGDGDLVWGEGVPVSAGRLAEVLDSLIAAPDGGAIVTVRYDVHDPLARSVIRSHRLLPDGTRAWGAAGVPLSDPRARASDYASYGQIDGNRVRFAWTHQQVANTYRFDIYVAEYTLAGRRLVRSTGRPLYTEPDAQWLRGFAYDHERHVGLAIFDEFRPTDPDRFDTLGAIYPGLP